MFWSWKLGRWEDTYQSRQIWSITTNNMPSDSPLYPEEIQELKELVFLQKWLLVSLKKNKMIDWKPAKRANRILETFSWLMESGYSEAENLLSGEI